MKIWGKIQPKGVEVAEESRAAGGRAVGFGEEDAGGGVSEGVGRRGRRGCRR